MPMTLAGSWVQEGRPTLRPALLAERAGTLFAAGMLGILAVSSILSEAAAPNETPDERAGVSSPTPEHAGSATRETFVAGYVAQPLYARSDVHMTRPDGTDLTLKALGWDGDALRFPIDGGVRAVSGAAPLSFMVDFLHNKAVARLGKGAHGRKLKNPVIEDVDTEGTLKGGPAPGRVKLTEVFDRLEFTHGHNVLLFTPLLRLANITPRIRPYLGVGAGFALPHVEVWFPREARDRRTSEYQFAGPAAQAVAGVEIRTGRMAYFIEYKFSYAWISAALSGDESWLNFDMPGDLLRQLQRWWRGEEPAFGRLGTTLAAHQIAVGAGYWLQGTRAPP